MQVQNLFIQLLRLNPMPRRSKSAARIAPVTQMLTTCQRSIQCFRPGFIVEEVRLENLTEIRAQCHKTFYGRDLRMFVINQGLSLASSFSPV
jgi:hypothetical protein